MKKLVHYRVLLGIAAFVLLFFAQILMGKAGTFFADMIPYQKIDPYGCFAGISIHHAIMMIIAIIAIIILSRILKTDFYFRLGDKSKGLKYVAVYTATFVVISVVVHTFMLARDRLPVYNYPLDSRNVFGVLGFNLLLTGPAEEIIYRALAITIFIKAFGKSVPIKGNLTLEVLLASVLFAFAHTKWSLNPFVFDLNLSNVIYAFALGTIQGIVYQKCKSIVYPILMHSFSNVLMVGGGYLYIIIAG